MFNRSVVELDLGCPSVNSLANQNKIGELGAKALAQLLEKQRFLSKINLAYNQIGDKGFVSIILSVARATLSENTQT